MQKRLAEALVNAPALVGTSPRMATRGPEQVARRINWRGPIKTQGWAGASVGDRQEVVQVVAGEATVDELLFREISGELKAPARQTLLNVCAVLAAFGLWDNLDHAQAEELLKALAVAVSQ